MGVMNLSISQGPSYTTEGRTDGILVYEREDSKGARDIRLVWSTEWGSERQKEWEITAAVSGYRKGQSYKTATLNYRQTFAASECHETKPNGSDGRVWWSHSLDIGSLLNFVLGSTEQWMYSTRQFDTVDFTVSVKSNFTEPLEDGTASSDKAWLSFSIGYCPEYEITNAYYEGDDKIAVEYSTTWTRIDDRYWFSTKQDEKGGICRIVGEGNLLSKEATGTIPQRGKLYIPTSSLTNHVMNKQVYFNVFFNAVYRPQSLYFNNATDTVTVLAHLDCNNVSVEVVEVGETIKLKAKDLGDVGLACETVTFKMKDGKYACDEVTVPIGEVAEFRFAPFGSRVVFEALGGTSNGGVSTQVATVEMDTGSTDRLVIDSISSDMRLFIDKVKSGSRTGPSVKTSPSVETVKLAGRRRPSAFYGVGGETSVSFSGMLLEDDGQEFETLAEQGGDVMLRFPDGRRYAITPEIDVERTSYGIVEVSISGDEVSA